MDVVGSWRIFHTVKGVRVRMMQGLLISGLSRISLVTRRALHSHNPNRVTAVVGGKNHGCGTALAFWGAAVELQTCLELPESLPGVLSSFRHNHAPLSLQGLRALLIPICTTQTLTI